ncbi:hypothetical protein L2E82_06014 [Cichorium intybus]|uniref:Uncharacterized protein n=1 Tax=Cichorium intybus TaxID=13427 RepID=A0ACB9H8D2_CICIN|nr:hypothetical protein L2E82_06014 [Cichorium intybus]
MAVVATPLSVFSIFFILTSIPVSSLPCPIHQKQALLRFKSTLTTIFDANSDPNTDDFVPFEELDSWNPKSDCCTWDRVNCTRTRNKTRFVTELHLDAVVPLRNLSTNSLEGRLGPELGSLRNLTTLTLSVNNFQGMIPPELFKLESLRFLDLSNNSLHGGLSSDVGKEIGNLTKLRELWLEKNQFTGGIPSSVENMKDLESLDLSVNSFSLQIPAGLGRLPNMTTLDLSKNQFVGPIPPSMQNFEQVRNPSAQEQQAHRRKR